MIVGLGNPGRKYEGTRHNVGFMVLDRLAAATAFESRPRLQAHTARLPSGELLLKPQTFMNLSGRSVREALAYHHWEPSQMLIVYDDVALPLGRLRLREKGSAGGHNGIKSIVENLGTQEFPRLKVGIGEAGQVAMTDHVLGRFTADEGRALENTLASAQAAVQFLLSHGFAAAANQFNPSHSVTDPPSHEQELRRSDRPQSEGSRDLDR
jgi:PTH1 family peptidyl-tRNA hydrolase